MMKCWHLNLNSLNSIATDETYLGVLFTLLLRFSKFEAYKPFYLALEVRILGIEMNIGDVKAS